MFQELEKCFKWLCRCFRGRAGCFRVDGKSMYFMKRKPRSARLHVMPDEAFFVTIFLLSLGRRYVYSNTKLVNNLIITKLAPEISSVINCDKMLKSRFV